MKKLLLVILLVFTGYNYAQEVPAWIDTTVTSTSAAKYMSVSNAKPLPVNTLVPILRIQDSLLHGANVQKTYDLKGNYSFIEVAYSDTGAATDSIFAYVGICKTAGDTAWSRINAVDLSDWSTDEAIIPGLSTTKQYWIRGTRITLFRLTMSNVAVRPGQQGKFYIEAK